MENQRFKNKMIDYAHHCFSFYEKKGAFSLGMRRRLLQKVPFKVYFVIRLHLANDTDQHADYSPISLKYQKMEYNSFLQLWSF